MLNSLLEAVLEILTLSYLAIGSALLMEQWAWWSIPHLQTLVCGQEAVWRCKADYRNHYSGVLAEKHIGELIVGSVFDELHIKTSNSPEILIFKNFRTYFSHVSQTNLSYPPFVNEVNCSTTDDVEFLNELQKDAKNLATHLLTKNDANDIPREDYKELLELLLYSFQEPLPHKPFKFKRPGATHKAQWMGKVIYAVKLSLLSTEAEKVMDPSNEKRHLPYLFMYKLVIFVPNNHLKLGGGVTYTWECDLNMSNFTIAQFVLIIHKNQFSVRI